MRYYVVADVHGFFIGHWYALIVAGLYCIVPNVDWYALCYLILQGACMGLMLYRLLEQRKETHAKIWITLFVFLWSVILGIQTVTQITFTTTAAVLGVTVIFWYMTMREMKKPELAVLFVGMAVAFAVSMIVIKFLMDYIKKHDFKVFGWYRIVLGAIVLGYFVLTAAF